MRLATPVSDQIVDLSGSRCPHLVIAIIAALNSMKSKQVLQVIATDPVAPSSIASWARQSGNTLLDMYEENDRFIFFLERAPLFMHRAPDP